MEITISRRTALVLALAGLLGVLLWWQWFPVAREPAYQHQATWGEEAGPARLAGPVGIALLSDEVFVSDAEAHRIVVYDRQGHYRRSFGERGSKPGQLDRPMHITAHEGKLYVAEYLNDRIQVFSPGGESLAIVGTTGNGPGEFDAPGGVAVDEEGRLWVADFYNHRVQLLDPHGLFVRQLGATGNKGRLPGRFNYPTDVAVLGSGAVAVADAYNDRIQLFDPSGEPLGRLGGPLALGLAGPFRGWFRVATGVASGPREALFVADFFNHRIQKISSDGRFLVAFGKPGRGGGELDRPTDTAVAEDGRVFVADFGNGRVQVFVQERETGEGGG